MTARKLKQDYEQKVIHIGTSIGIVIPKHVAKALKIASGDYLQLSLEDGMCLKLNKKNDIQEGWDEMFERYAKEGEDKNLIPEFLDKSLFRS